MKTPLIQQVFRLAMPVAVQSMLVSVLSMSDVFMITSLGDSAIAAVGLSARVHFVLIILMAGFGMAISILVAQYHGRGNLKPSQSILAIGITIGLSFLVPVAIVLFALPANLLALLSEDGQMIALGADYLRLTVPLLFFTHIIIAYESALRARGETMLPLVLSSVAIVLNIVLNYLLIHGVGPFPTLGVSGVAIASDIARFVQVLLIVWYMHRYRHAFAVSQLYQSLTNARVYLVRYFNTAWPIIINFSLWGTGTFVYSGIAAKMGTEAMAALSLVGPIESMYHSLFMGLSTACAVLIGQNLGRNDFNYAKSLAAKFAFFSPLLAMCVGLLLLLASFGFLPLLLEKGTPLYELAIQLMWIMCLTFWIKTLNLTLINGILRAGGDNKFVLGVDMFSMWGLGIPASLLVAFVFDLSYAWVYAMVLIDEIAKAILVGYRAWKGRWLNNLTEDTDEDEKAESLTV